MPVYVIDTLKPKNGLDFPVVEAIDVAVQGYTSLADAVTHFATDTAIVALTAALDTKASKTTTDSLQAQIDQIAQAAGTGTADTEVAQARISDGITYPTLSARLEGDYKRHSIGLSWHSDGYITAIGTVGSSPGRHYSDYILCGENMPLKYIAETNYANVCGISYYDSNFHFISGEKNVGEMGTEISTVSPDNTCYCRLSTKDAILNQSIVKFDKNQIPFVLKQIADNISDNANAIAQSNEIIAENTGKINTSNVYFSEAVSQLSKNQNSCTPYSIISESTTVNADGSVTVAAGGYYFLYFELSTIKDYVLVKADSTIEAKYMYINEDRQTVFSDSINSLVLSDGSCEIIIDKNAPDILYDKYVVRLDNRQGSSSITIKFSIKNVTVATETADTVLLSRIDSGIYTKRPLVNDVTQSSCTHNADGSITIAAGGYYFPTYNAPIDNKGNTVIRIKGNTGHINVARNSGQGGGGVTPYFVTETVNGYELLIISKDDWNVEYPYMTLRFDNRQGNESITINEIIVGDTFLNTSNDSNKLIYVSTIGNDENDGTKAQPLATVNAALIKGATVISVGGGIYEQSIDLSKAKVPCIEIRNDSINNRVIFTDANRVIGSAETKVQGKTSVYSMPYSSTIEENNNIIWQNGVPDASTLITDAERHPLERGYQYRCEDTAIRKCESTSLSDALEEIDSSSIYKWYHDSTNNILYFSRPEPVSVTHPLCYSLGNRLFSNGSKALSLKLVGIETKYIAFNVSELSSVEVIDCKAANIYDTGAFVYDRCRSALFVRCEAVMCQYGTTGDGFNAHSTAAGDTFSKQTDVTFIDCYSHDNNDDGYSDHERSETAIIGGLYEYNGKAGVTPSYGSHCTCYNVYSRKNYNGFYCCGDATEAEGGKYTQMICYNCVAENNTTGGSMQYGYAVTGVGNSVTLIACKSINNLIGYYCGQTSAMTITDCGSLDDSTIKTNNVVVKNTTIVS